MSNAQDIEQITAWLFVASVTGLTDITITVSVLCQMANVSLEGESVLSQLDLL